jgi:hypothetical protein
VNVTAAGAGSPELIPSAVNTLPNIAASPDLSPHSRSEHDSVSTSLHQLTSPPILNLLQTVEDRIFPGGSQHVESIRTPSHSAMDGLYSHPAQAPAPDLARGTFDVRDSAEKLVAKAAHTIETAGFHGQRVPDDLDPRAVLALANQFIATGQIPNYLRAAEIGRVVISWYDEASLASFRLDAEAAALYRRPSLRMRFYAMVGTIWRRAPLLLLLIGWLLSGGFAALLVRIIGVPGYKTALAFEIWAIGFPALAVFQFVVTIRGTLRPKSRAPSRSRENEAP